MADTMKAAVFREFGDLDNVHLEEVEIPEPGEGELLVRVEAAGVNPVDAAIVRGYLKRSIPHEFPVIPGWDISGIIEERGFSARRFEVGDTVFGYARRPLVQWGTFAQYLVIPESYLSRGPENIPPVESGGIPLVGLTAYQSLYDAGRLKSGESVLILGASGGVGSMAVQLAKNTGAHVIGIASQKNHGYMEDFGADETIDYEKANVGNAVKEIYAEGVDLIFDCAGGETLQQSLSALKPNGRLVSIVNRGNNLDPGIDHKYVFVEPNSSQLEELRKLVEAGKMSTHVADTFGLSDVSKALRKVETLHTTGKLVVEPW